MEDGGRRPWKRRKTVGGYQPNAPSFFDPHDDATACRQDHLVPLELPSNPPERSRRLLETEWIVTNGLGGYSSSSMANVITRRYHGVLVAALPNPLGRVVMLNHVGERIVMRRRASWLNDEDLPAGRSTRIPDAGVRSARLEAGLPVWEYEVEGVRIEKRVMMPHRQNTVYVTYRLLDGADAVRLELLPAVHFRGYEDRVDSRATRRRRRATR